MKAVDGFQSVPAEKISVRNKNDKGARRIKGSVERLCSADLFLYDRNSLSHKNALRKCIYKMDPDCTYCIKRAEVFSDG